MTFIMEGTQHFRKLSFYELRFSKVIKARITNRKEQSKENSIRSRASGRNCETQGTGIRAWAVVGSSV